MQENRETQSHFYGKRQTRDALVKISQIMEWYTMLKDKPRWWIPIYLSTQYTTLWKEQVKTVQKKLMNKRYKETFLPM